MNKSSILNTLILLPIYWLFSGMLLMGGGDKPMVAMVIISVLTTLYCYGLTSAKENIVNNKVLWILFTIVGYTLFCYHYHGVSSREIRALLSASVFLTFFPHRLLTRKTLCLVTILGSICSLSYAFYYGQIIEIPRWQWPFNAIPQATISASIGLISLCSLYSSKGLQKYSFTLAFIISTLAVFISQSRGIWGGYFLISGVLTLVRARHHFMSKKTVLSGFIIIFLCAFSLKPVIETRIQETESEVSRITSGNLDTSFGFRIQMWQLSPHLIKNNVLLGAGDEHSNRFKELYQRGLVSEHLMLFNPSHYHNQYIDRVIKNGLFGLFLLFALLLAPIHFRPKQRRVDCNIIGSLASLYAIAGLTDVPFNHPQPILFYTFIVCILSTAVTQKKEYD